MKYPIRVLHVVRYLEQGGIQNLLMNLYRDIDRNEVQFDFLVCGKGVFDDEIRQLGGKIFYMPYLTEVGQIEYKNNLIEFFKEHKEYKIVHSHMNQVSGIVLEAAHLAGVPARIAHSHTTGNKNNVIAKIYKKYLQHKINKNATNLIACSEEAAQWLFTKRAKETLIINNGINLDKFKFSQENRNIMRKTLNLTDDTIVIGNVGRFSKVKNHVFMIEIFKDFRKVFNSKLLLIGEGELKEKIIEMAKQYNILQDIIFKVEKEHVENYYNVMDIYICPSLYEGIPLSLIEAQTNGIPIIASNTIDSRVKITSNFCFESLSAPNSIWIDEMKELLDIGRKDNVIDVKKHGYDIKEQTLRLEDLYSKIYKDIGEKND